MHRKHHFLHIKKVNATSNCKDISLGHTQQILLCTRWPERSLSLSSHVISLFQEAPSLFNPKEAQGVTFFSSSMCLWKNILRGLNLKKLRSCKAPIKNHIHAFFCDSHHSKNIFGPPMMNLEWITNIFIIKSQISISLWQSVQDWLQLYIQ
jgi:hypothetical protein